MKLSKQFLEAINNNDRYIININISSVDEYKNFTAALENETDIKWSSGCKPTEYNNYIGYNKLSKLVMRKGRDNMFVLGGGNILHNNGISFNHNTVFESPKPIKYKLKQY